MDILTGLAGQPMSHLCLKDTELFLQLLQLLGPGFSLLLLRFSKLQSLFKLLKPAAAGTCHGMFCRPQTWQLPELSRQWDQTGLPCYPEG